MRKSKGPSVCNAIETILVHQDIAAKYLPLLYEQFQNCVEIRGEPKCSKIYSLSTGDKRGLCNRI